jgi:hypothetical protein
MVSLQNSLSGSLLASMMLAVGAVPASASHEGIFELFLREERPDYDEPPAEWRKPRGKRSGTIFDLFEAERKLQPTETEQPAKKPRKLTSKPARKKATDRKSAEQRQRVASLPKPAKSSLPRRKPAVAPPLPAAQAAKPEPARISCGEARTIITKYAFSGVMARSCTGDTYSFAAMRTGKPYAVKISAITGELVEVKKGAPQTGASVGPSAEAGDHLVPKSLLPKQ